MQLPSCNTLKFFLHALGSVEIGPSVRWSPTGVKTVGNYKTVNSKSGRVRLQEWSFTRDLFRDHRGFD